MGIDFDKLIDPRQRPASRRSSWWWVWALLLFIVFIGAESLVTLITEWLWFASVDQTAVMRTRVFAPLAVFGFVFVVVGLWLAGNWLWASRRAGGEVVWPGQPQAQLSLPRTRPLVLGAAAFVALLLAMGAAAQWETMLLYLNRASFDVAEPILERDVAFYVFDLPLFRLGHAVAMSALVTALVGAAIVYMFGGVLDLRLYTSADGLQELRRRVVGLPRQVRLHFWLLAAGWSLLWAVGQWLARFDLLTVARRGGAFYGPGYADVIARLPAYNALVIIGILVAILFLLTIRGGRPWLPIGGLVLLFALRVLLLGAYPAVLQQYRVTPNELAFERPYITHNITMTRAAFGLDQVSEVEYEPRGELTPDLLDDHGGTIENVRLWDWRTLLQSFRQLQEFRTYYDFLDVDIDRYQLAGGQRQAELASREITPSGLQTQNPTWVNRHLEFTHGFGVVLTPVDEVDGRGLPVLWVGDIPPETRAPFELTVAQPRIYFGEAADDQYVIVNTDEGEFDFPSGADNVRTAYDGADGVSLGPLLRRLLFALRFGDSEIFFSSALKAESRILIHRNIGERVRRLAPFLTYDPDPYMVITADGRLVWIYDAYTTSDRFPYSQPVVASDLQFGDAGVGELQGRNYIRNSVKVVIDAYDGSVMFYVMRPDDPLIAAWSGVFPTLFRPVAEMPADLVAHWRYPEALFRAQATIFRRFHMAEADTFYNAEDLWAVPTQSMDQETTLPMQPYYVTLRLRGEPEEEFLLMLPFTPVRKQNMIAWLAARSDPPHYGEIVLYSFAKGQIVFGPQQIESRIDQDPVISSQLTLWGQRGSRAIRGNMLVIPIGDTLLYLEPLYLQAESSALPELKQVIVASGDKVVMRPTLSEALAAWFVAANGLAVSEPVAGDEVAANQAAPESAAASDRSTGLQSETDIAVLVGAARDRERAAAEALGDGDWLRFGREMDALAGLIERLAELTGADVPAGEVPTAAPPEPAEATPVGTAPVGTPP